ncbi:PepSY domain-containing protein [Streptomyces sp. N35]|uniref:PepSY-associated TM helix domain-containing protein n=1 Tax=Streptomyces sp. N35 TaxID=2795730 RepID=UPI0018F6C305|nr:PepSY domain-containing protein [Streptomyces sp. N35]
MAIDDRPKPEQSEPSEPTPPAGTTPATDPAAKPGAWSALRPLLLRLHFYAGILIAPFLFVAAASGLLYALSFQAEKIVYSHELEVPVGDSALPLTQQVEAAKEAHPEGTVTAVWPSYEDGMTTRVLFDSPEVDEGKTLAVFVDPYNGEIRGELPSYGGSGALPVRAWTSELHRHLHLGEPGRHYSELAASWLWVVVLGGLLLWFARRRARRRELLGPARDQKKGRARTLSWHGSIGLWAALGLLFLSATGLTWSKYAGVSIGELQDSLGGATPAVDAATTPAVGADSGHGDHGGGGDHAAHEGADVGLDRILEIARGEGLDGRTTVTVPTEGQGYVVKQNDTTWPYHLDSVAIDPADGKVLDKISFADYPLLAKLTSLGINLHMGVLFGLANQLLLAALMLGTMLLIFWGYRMWWLRRPTRSGALGMGRPMPRGTWRKVPLPVLLPLLAVTAVIGWYVPLFGLSLLAFLLVDAVAGAVGRARSRTAA